MFVCEIGGVLYKHRPAAGITYRLRALLSAAQFALERLQMSSKGYSPLRAARMRMMKGAINVTTSRRGVTKCLYPFSRMNSARARICYRRPPRAPLPLPEPLLAEDFPLFPLSPSGFPF